jgi:hypothetical protein
MSIFKLRDPILLRGFNTSTLIEELEEETELQGWGENYQQDWPMGWYWVIEAPLIDDIGQQKALE